MKECSICNVDLEKCAISEVNLFCKRCDTLYLNRILHNKCIPTNQINDSYAICETCNLCTSDITRMYIDDYDVCQWLIKNISISDEYIIILFEDMQDTFERYFTLSDNIYRARAIKEDMLGCVRQIISEVNELGLSFFTIEYNMVRFICDALKEDMGLEDDDCIRIVQEEYHNARRNKLK